MNLLQSAIRTVLMFCDDFSIIKKADIVEEGDYLKIISFQKEENGYTVILLVKNASDIKNYIDNPTITKIFYSSEIKDEFAYLSLVFLGVEYLKKMGDFDDMEKSYRIMLNQIEKERRAIYMY